MNLRAAFPAALLLLLLYGRFAHADEAPIIPSRESTIVLPLLDKLKPQASAKIVLNQIQKILGKEDFADAGGPIERFRSDSYYRLDDKSQVIVQTVLGTHRIIEISIRIADSDKRVLYPAPKSPADASRTVSGD